MRFPRILLSILLLILAGTACSGKSPGGRSVNRSIYLNGKQNGSLVLIPFHPAQNLYSRTRAFTYEAWIKPLCFCGDGPIISKAFGMCKDNWVLGYGVTGLVLSTGNSCSGKEILVVNQGIRLGIWQHVAGVWTGDSLLLFLNGGCIARQAYAGTPTADSIPMSLGCYYAWNGTYRTFQGYLAEVRYSSTARYRDRFAPGRYFMPDSETIFLYHCDDSSAAELIDSSPYRVNAQLRDVRRSEDSPDDFRWQNAVRPTTRLLVHLNEERGEMARDEAGGAVLRVNGGMVDGHWGRGRRFAGNGVMLSLPVGSQPLIRPGIEELTLDLWLRPQHAHGQSVVLARLGRGLALELTPAGALHGILRGVDSAVSFSTDCRTVLNHGRWNHVAITWSGPTRIASIQVNGVAAAASMHAPARLHGVDGPAVFLEAADSVLIDIDEIRIEDVALNSIVYPIQLPPGFVKVVDELRAIRVNWANRGRVPLLLNRVYRSVDSSSFVPIGETRDTVYVDSTADRSLDCWYAVSAIDSLGYESPMTASDMIAPNAMSRSEKYLWGAAIVAALGVSTVGWVLARRSRLRDKRPLASHNHDQQVRPNRIQLFGEFRVWDRDGKDIRLLFTPLIRQLFLLLLFNGEWETKGISSERISSILWPDASPAQAKNRRGVALQKLRDLLTRIDGVTMVNEDHHWKISVQEPASFDLHTHLLQVSAKEDAPSTGVAAWQTYFDAVNEGPVLDGTDYEWLEPVKARIAREVDRLCSLHFESKAGDPSLALRAAETLLRWDRLHEKALRTKVRILRETGRTGEARSAYDAFVRAHNDIVGTPFRSPFPDM